MRRTEWLQETRLMRFEEAYGAWTESRLTQEEAAELLGVCARTFRRYIDRYEDDGLDGLIDKRLEQVSHRRAPVDEVVRLADAYRNGPVLTRPVRVRESRLEKRAIYVLRNRTVLFAPNRAFSGCLTRSKQERRGG